MWFSSKKPPFWVSTLTHSVNTVYTGRPKMREMQPCSAGARGLVEEAGVCLRPWKSTGSGVQGDQVGAPRLRSGVPHG